MTEEEIWEQGWAKYTPLDMMLDMREVFAPQRAMEMVAWMLVFGAVNADTHVEMVERVMKLGFKRSAVYAASGDIKKFQAFLKQKWEGHEVSREDLAKKISSINSFGSLDFAV